MYYINGTERVSELVKALADHPDGLSLSVQSLQNFLLAFLEGKYSQDELLCLAEFIEMNDQVHSISSDSKKINDVIFSLANPLIQLPNSIDKVNLLLKSLSV